ncbi:hypothetical protein [Bradyrhizobium algeriense]|uniref:hypothetical protein n=1 Tax=Bradyrhizobium algeriense TaxID=634784 RepID=UPI00167E5918|nr:hypothetical protein [Bradyrhizobium algeriense]
MDFVKMTCGLRLGHKLSYAVVQRAFRQQIGASVCTALIVYGGPFAKHGGRIESNVNVVRVHHFCTRSFNVAALPLNSRELPDCLMLRHKTPPAFAEAASTSLQMAQSGRPQ